MQQEEYEVFRLWHDFAPWARGAEVAVVVMDGHGIEEAYSALALALSCAVCMVVVGEGETSTDAWQDRPTVTLVASQGGDADALRRAISSAESAVWRRKIGHAFSRSEVVPGLVKRAVAEACFYETRPVRTATKIAARLRCPRTSIARRWHELAGSTLHFHDLLSWIMLDVALRHHQRYGSCRQACQALGVPEQTVRAMAERCTGATLAQLAQGGRPGLHRLFDERVLLPLLGIRVTTHSGVASARIAPLLNTK